jgi:hypothetical protein
VYDELDSTLRSYVDALVRHAATALWPERYQALQSFWTGIAKCDPAEHRAATTALGLELSEDVDPAEVVFRLVLTAYLEQLDETEVTNPDQALTYSLSLDGDHVEQAERWLATHPEHRG